MQNKKVLKILGVAAVSAMILSGCNFPIIPQSAEPDRIPFWKLCVPQDQPDVFWGSLV